MNNETLRLKLKQRLNKIASNDYDNIENWQIIEAFNKAQLEWVRRQLHGNNLYREGDEMSKRRIDDLQILLTEYSLTGASNNDYFESNNFPIDTYLEYKGIKAKAKSECCTDPRTMSIYLVENENVGLYLRDPLKNPNFEWSETIATLIGNKVRIYKSDFDIVSPVLIFYRKPVNIEFTGVTNPYTGIVSTTDITPEFKDDIVELILDEAASLIAGDIDNFNQMQREQQSAERNN